MSSGPRSSTTSARSTGWRPFQTRGDLAEQPYWRRTPARAIFRELRSQFDGLLPSSVILDCVDHAVQDLLRSISAESLTEMAIGLATVRIEHRIRSTDQ